MINFSKCTKCGETFDIATNFSECPSCRYGLNDEKEEGDGNLLEL